MVDRKARDEYAQLLRHFFAGRMTNDDFDDAGLEIAFGTKDPAIWQIHRAAWFCYSDMYTHRMTGKWAPNRETRLDIARCILFLHSNLEYEWPITPFWWGLLNLLTLGIFGLIWPQEPVNPNTWQWPFFNEYTYEHAKAHPRYLSGGNPSSPELAQA